MIHNCRARELLKLFVAYHSRDDVSDLDSWEELLELLDEAETYLADSAPRKTKGGSRVDAPS